MNTQDPKQAYNIFLEGQWPGWECVPLPAAPVLLLERMGEVTARLDGWPTFFYQEDAGDPHSSWYFRNGSWYRVKNADPARQPGCLFRPYAGENFHFSYPEEPLSAPAPRNLGEQLQALRDQEGVRLQERLLFIELMRRRFPADLDLGPGGSISLTDGLPTFAMLHLGEEQLLPVLRRLRRLADGPVVKRKVFFGGAPAGFSGSLHLELRFGGKAVCLATHVKDYRRYVRTGEYCQPAPGYYCLECK